MERGDSERVEAGWALATPTERGVLVRRRAFSYVPTNLRLLYAAVLAISVLGGAWAPIFFVLAAFVVGSVVGLLSVLTSGAEWSVAPLLRPLRHRLEIISGEGALGNGDYRDAPRADRARVILDGREIADVRDVRVLRRTSEDGTVKAFALYLVGDQTIVHVTVTRDADAARALRQLLRDALGLERGGGVPVDEGMLWSLGCIGFLLSVPYLGVSGWVFFMAFTRFQRAPVDQRAWAFAGAALVAIVVEVVFARLVALLARRAGHAWVEETFRTFSPTETPTSRRRSRAARR